MLSCAPVAHTCNPSYSEGRNQEDRSLKAVQAVQENTLRDPILRKPIKKRGWWSGSRCRP
jgi:hypothetical protein